MVSIEYVAVTRGFLLSLSRDRVVTVYKSCSEWHPLQRLSTCQRANTACEFDKMSDGSKLQSPQNPQQQKKPEEHISPYQVMLASAPDDYLTNLEGAIKDYPPEFPVYYFFYGTLTAPKNLQRILGLPEEPQLRKSQIVGYALAKWGDYPALIDDKQDQIVSGYAYLVQSEEEAQKLAYYETNAYKVAPLRITFTDDGSPARVRGKGFMYAGDAKALLEQRFDRKLWALQMGNKLETTLKGTG